MINIFYVESFFHLLVTDQIINSKGLPIDSCYFITERGTVLPERYSKRLLYDGAKYGLVNRIKLYYKQRRRIKRLFDKEEICAYMPFQFYLPSKRFFSKYVFFEEGFSAYAPFKMVVDKVRRRRAMLKRFLVYISMPFSSKNARGIVLGLSSDSTQLFQTTLYRLSDDAYRCLEEIPSFKVETIGEINRNPFTLSDIRNATILVMDRISLQGRPFDEMIYFKVLRHVISNVCDEFRPLYVKMHPVDYKNDEAQKRVLSILSIYKPFIIDENLENLALCNNNNVFIGTNSTILYYAPILGNSNKSISFSRLLAQEDTLYNDFLGRWGGVAAFCSLFCKQVECI